MESAHDSVPLFHYRNWAVDDWPSNFPDGEEDDDSFAIPRVAQSLEEAIAALPESTASPSSGGLLRSMLPSHHHFGQLKARLPPLHQHSITSLDASVDSKRRTYSLEQGEDDIATFLHDIQQEFEPWNPLTGSKASGLGTSALGTRRSSNYADYRPVSSSDYHTATTEIMPSEAFHSATSYISDQNAAMKAISVTPEYLKLLKVKGLWPVDPQIEQNWSGEGQHIEFKKDEIDKINKLLTVGKCLGSGAHGSVHEVNCRRILMARKTILTRRQFTKNDAIREVIHMTRLKHAHIIRLIGTYVRNRELCILMYPVADGNLETFLNYLCMASHEGFQLAATSQEIHSFDKSQVSAMATSCLSFFSCLSSAVEYIHGHITKHMDIKPANILVRSRWHYTGVGRTEYISKVYLSDFGISRSYETKEAANTDSNVGFTKRYAAPEVVQWLDHNLSVDIFSLGCVFLEMFAAVDSYHVSQTLCAYTWRMWSASRETGECQQLCTLHEELEKLFDPNNNPDKTYQGNIAPLQEIIKTQIPRYERPSILKSTMLRMISRMLQAVPHDRPTAGEVVGEFGEKLCCNAGTIELEAIDVHVEDDPATYREYEIMVEPMRRNGDDDASQNQVKAAAIRDSSDGHGFEADRYLLLGLDRGAMSLLTDHMGCEY